LCCHFFIAKNRPITVAMSDKIPMTVPTISGIVKPLLGEDFDDPVEALGVEFEEEETGLVANEDVVEVRLGLFRELRSS
jgi:hypothetical protein